jgi:hypothetical protein
MKNLFLSMHKGLLIPLRIAAFAATISLFAIAPAEAQTKPSFDIGEPANIVELPEGEFRAAFEALPSQAQGRALGLLRQGKVPVEDFVHLRVNRRGDLLFVDPDLEGEFVQGAEETTVPPSEISEANSFLLHSKPGATNILYLDFDGHDVQNSSWNYSSGKAVHPMRPYSRDADYYNFSQTEIDIIVDSWRQVSEDLAPFDIDVTTQEPVSFGSNVGHVLVTQKLDADGELIYDCNCGGVAWVNVWGSPGGFPGLVFNISMLGVVEAASHEFGHNLGLYHDGVTGGTAYYRGHGVGSVSWGSIMGVGYYTNVTQWNQGEYTGANNPEDDLLEISNRLGYQADDHEDVQFEEATPLVITNGTDVSSLGRVSDPSWATFDNKGIIEDRDDIDLFSMNVGAGTLDLTATPAHHEVYPGSTRRGSNLDIEVTLLDNFGSVLQTSNPDFEINANINYAVIAPGTYYLEVTGVGRGDPLADGYTDYASIGQYHIHGTVPLPVIEILAPADGTIEPGGTVFVFVATADDFEAGDISADISWSSDVDGNLGSGGNIVAMLTGGTPAITHVVTASVIDSASNTYTASITVHVNNNPVPVPVIEILAPADGTTQPGGTVFVFEATADDFEDGDISANISWSSDVDGFLGIGRNIQTTLTADTSAITTHIVTASVIDSHSNASTASITVHGDNTTLLVPLGLAAAFGALTPNAAFASTGVTTFYGDIGSSTFAIAPAGTHIGDSYLVPAFSGAASDVVDAYADAEGRPAGTPLPGNISGLTVGPGVHSNPAAVGSTAGTVFIIDGKDNPDAVFIFQIGGALTLGANF